MGDGYDPFSPEVLAEPSCPYAFLHGEAPVHRYPDFDPPFYTLSRYKDVEAGLRDIATFSSEFGQGPRFTPPRGMLSDPPQHTFFRGLVQQSFTNKAMLALAPRVAEIADELLAARSPDSWDLHDDFAFPLPVIVIAEVLGVPKEDLNLFKKWSDSSVAAMGAKDPTPYQADQADMGQYLLREIADRRKMPREDLISALVAAKDGDRGLDDMEILGVVNQLLVGGNETTTSLITNMVWRLLERPELWERLRNDPDLVETAVEESLRYDPPVLGLFRNSTKDVALHGETIPAESKVFMLYAAANRDASEFPEPDAFSLDRPHHRHLSFGLGVHFCLGAPLARLEAQTALRALLTHAPEIELVSAGDRITPFFLWGRKHLPVRG
ncbi:MAG: cytochrome P450 [Dehalococcoidia bacterium]